MGGIKVPAPCSIEMPSRLPPIVPHLSRDETTGTMLSTNQAIHCALRKPKEAPKEKTRVIVAVDFGMEVRSH